MGGCADHVMTIGYPRYSAGGGTFIDRPSVAWLMDAAEIRDRLRAVEDPELEDDIVSLGLVDDIEITTDETGTRTVTIALGLGAPYAPAERTIGSRIREVLAPIDATIDLRAKARGGPSGSVLPEVRNVIVVASGKGGVGKSTVATNLAAGLAELGAEVGLFDADIYGPNVPRMLSAEEPPEVAGDETLVPPTKFGVKLISMEFLTDDDTPVIWRGPMVDQALTQLLETVEWGPLDYLVVDLPPGTGDTQLTVLQTMPVTGAVIVTTSQDVALDDARKAVEMFGRHETPVLGIVENMSTFVCPDCGSEHDIFESGGGEELARAYELPFLGAIPLDTDIQARDLGDEPTVLAEGTESSATLRAITEHTADAVGVIRRRAHAEATEELTHDES